MTFRRIAIVTVVAAALGACQTTGNGQKEFGGTLLGAGLGGLIGSQIGNGTGQLAATAIGTLAGGDCVGEMGYLSDGERTASALCISRVTALVIRSPVKEWASFPLQVRLTKTFQRTLIDRLAKTSEDLSTHVG